MIQTTLPLAFQRVLEWSVWSRVLLAKNIFELHICCLKLISSSTIKILLVCSWFVGHSWFVFGNKEKVLAFSQESVLFLSLVLCGVPTSYLPHIYPFYSAVVENFSISSWKVNTFNIILLLIIVIFTKNHSFNSIFAWLIVTHHFWNTRKMITEKIKWHCFRAPSLVDCLKIF